MRIVSLIPSATEIVALVGAADDLVGRSHECDWPPNLSDRPILTAPTFEFSSSAEVDANVSRSISAGESLYRLDSARLHELRPDLIITQSLCSVCSIDEGSVHATIADLPKKPEVLALNPASFEDVLDDIIRVGHACGRPDTAFRAVTQLRERFFRASDHMNAFADPVPTAFLEWTDPLFVAGHWTPQLIERAGGEHRLNPTHAMAHSGAGAGGQMAHRVAGPGRVISIEDLVTSRPRALIVSPCGLDLDRTARELAPLQAQTWWQQLPAVKNGKVAIVDGNQMFSRPGPRLVDAYEWLVGWLNDVPDLVPRDFPWRPAA